MLHAMFQLHQPVFICIIACTSEVSFESLTCGETFPRLHGLYYGLPSSATSGGPRFPEGQVISSPESRLPASRWKSGKTEKFTQLNQMTNL